MRQENQAKAAKLTAQRFTSEGLQAQLLSTAKYRFRKNQ